MSHKPKIDPSHFLESVSSTWFTMAASMRINISIWQWYYLSNSELNRKSGSSESPCEVIWQFLTQFSLLTLKRIVLADLIWVGLYVRASLIHGVRYGVTQKQYCQKASLIRHALHYYQTKYETYYRNCYHVVTKNCSHHTVSHQNSGWCAVTAMSNLGGLQVWRQSHTS